MRGRGLKYVKIAVQYSWTIKGYLDFSAANKFRPCFQWSCYRGWSEFLKRPKEAWPSHKHQIIKQIQLHLWFPHLGLLLSLARLNFTLFLFFFYSFFNFKFTHNFVDTESSKVSHSAFTDMRTGATYTAWWRQDCRCISTKWYFTNIWKLRWISSTPVILKQLQNGSAKEVWVVNKATDAIKMIGGFKHDYFKNNLWMYLWIGIERD